MAEHQGPFLIGEVGGFTTVGIGHLGGFFNVGNEVFPGGGKALIALRFGTTLHQGFHHPSRGDFLAATVEDLFLKLGNQRQGLIAELDGELCHEQRGKCSNSEVALATPNSNS